MHVFPRFVPSVLPSRTPRLDDASRAFNCCSEERGDTLLRIFIQVEAVLLIQT